MNIKEITVTASASKNYQKFEVSLTAEITNDNDFITLKDIAINNALTGIDELANTDNKEPTVTVKVDNTPTQQAPYRRIYNPTPSTPVPPANNNTYNNPKKATDKQIALLKRLNYTGDLDTVTSKEASAFIDSKFAKV